MAPSNTSYHVRVNFAAKSQPSNYITNGWNVLWNGTGTPTTTDLTTAANDIWSFYNSVFGGSNSISQFLGIQCSRVTNDVIIDVYNVDLLDDRHHLGTPVLTLLKTLGAAVTSTALPAEVSVCLSIRSAYGTDPEHDGVTRPRAQDRGRIYIGPLDTSAASSTTATGGGNVVVSSALGSQLVTASQGIKTALQGHNWAWAVWSRSDKVFKIVSYIAQDGFFDTQRRRGPQQALQTWQLLA